MTKKNEKEIMERLGLLERAAELMLKHIRDAGVRQSAYARRMNAVQADDQAAHDWNVQAQENAQAAQTILDSMRVKP